MVYVNYGAPGDYEQLERLGISVKGAIVIARYGETWRGIKPKVAAEHGAVGCLIYSDPQQDGYFHGDPYPDGAMRPAEGAQRGSVMDMPVFLVILKHLVWAQCPEQKRSAQRGTNHHQNSGDAHLLLGCCAFLKSLSAPLVPEPWRGGLPMTYHVGPSTAKAHMVMKFNWDRKPL